MTHDAFWLSISSDHRAKNAVQLEVRRNPGGNQAWDGCNGLRPIPCRSSSRLVAVWGVTSFRCCPCLLIGHSHRAHNVYGCSPNADRASGAVRAGGSGGLTLLSDRRGANSSMFPPTSPAVTTIAAMTSKDSLVLFCMARPCNLSS